MLRAVLRSLAHLCLATAVAASPAHAGAWLQERGQGLLILKSTYDRATTEFDAVGDTGGLRDFRKIEGQIYAEWGLRESVTLLLAPTIQSIRDDGFGFQRKATGLAFTELGARVRLWRGDFSVLSVQPLVVLPGTLGSSDNAVLASGRTDIELRILGGHGFTLFGAPLFIDLQGAWRRRGGEADDEWRADAVLGLTLAPKWQILAQSFSIFGSDSFSLHKGQLSLVQKWSDCTSVEFGYWQAYAGRNVVREQAMFTSLWIRL